MRPSLLALSLVLSGAAAAEDRWTEFRGPGGTGHSDSTGLPLEWSESRNVAWKTPIHGRGWSSPVVLGSQVWLTTATREGTSCRCSRSTATGARAPRHPALRGGEARGHGALQQLRLADAR